MAEFKARKDSGLTYDNFQEVNIFIGPRQFEKIANTARDFHEYMAETINTTWDDKEYNEGLRALPKAPKEVKEATRRTRNTERSRNEVRDEGTHSDSEGVPRAKGSRNATRSSESKKTKKAEARSSADEST